MRATYTTGEREFTTRIGPPPVGYHWRMEGALSKRQGRFRAWTLPRSGVGVGTGVIVQTIVCPLAALIRCFVQGS